MDQHPSHFPEDAYPDAPMTVKELPQEMRPREEFQRRGASDVPDDVLLAILLRSGVPGKNVTELARELLRRFKGLSNLAHAEYEELLGLKIKGLGKVKCMELASAFEISRRVMTRHQQHSHHEDAPLFRTPENVYQFIEPYTRGLQQEIFWVLLLNTKKKLIGQPIETSRGLLDATLIHPREIFSKAVRYSASSVILVHNHPSGDPKPSTEDLTITRRLLEAANILGITLIDHMVIGRPSATSPGYTSLRTDGLVDFG